MFEFGPMQEIANRFALAFGFTKEFTDHVTENRDSCRFIE